MSFMVIARQYLAHLPRRPDLHRRRHRAAPLAGAAAPARATHAPPRHLQPDCCPVPAKHQSLSFLTGSAQLSQPAAAPKIRPAPLRSGQFREIFTHYFVHPGLYTTLVRRCGPQPPDDVKEDLRCQQPKHPSFVGGGRNSSPRRAGLQGLRLANACDTVRSMCFLHSAELIIRQRFFKHEINILKGIEFKHPFQLLG